MDTVSKAGRRELIYSPADMNKSSFASSLTCIFQLARIDPSFAECRAIYLLDALILLGLVGSKESSEFRPSSILCVSSMAAVSRFFHPQPGLGIYRFAPSRVAFTAGS